MPIPEKKAETKELLKAVPPEQTVEEKLKDLFPDLDHYDESRPALKPEKPHRCSNCNRLIFTGSVGENGEVKHKCRCGQMNTFTPNKPAQNFQDRIFQNRAHKLK